MSLPTDPTVLQVRRATLLERIADGNEQEAPRRDLDAWYRELRAVEHRLERARRQERVASRSLSPSTPSECVTRVTHAPLMLAPWDPESATDDDAEVPA